MQGKLHESGAIELAPPPGRKEAKSKERILERRLINMFRAIEFLADKMDCKEDVKTILNQR